MFLPVYCDAKLEELYAKSGEELPMHVRMLSLQQLLSCVDHSICIAMACFDMFRSGGGCWRLLEVVAAKAAQAVGTGRWTLLVRFVSG